MAKKYTDLHKKMLYEYDETKDGDGLHLHRLALLAAIKGTLTTDEIIKILTGLKRYGNNIKTFNTDPKLKEFKREDYGKVGPNIKKYRILKCMQQFELAQKAGITPQVLSKYENNRTTYGNHQTLNKIAAALEIDIVELFK